MKDDFEQMVESARRDGTPFIEVRQQTLETLIMRERAKWDVELESALNDIAPGRREELRSHMKTVVNDWFLNLCDAVSECQNYDDFVKVYNNLNAVYRRKRSRDDN